ncbi:hypothetical protein Btru_017777, partial [Bulinus truncatus]
MILRNLKTEIVLLLYIVTVDLTDCADIANDGFFGPNSEYKCHCANGCNIEGMCINNDPCSKGWFGLKCQYQDLATIEGTYIQPSAVDILTDRNDATCLQNNEKTVNVIFNTTYVFTWMRIVVNNECRNIALKQVTWQSSNYSEKNITYDASKAVDGDASGEFGKNSCTHTQVNDSTPTWNVRFKSSEITRYVLHNRNTNEVYTPRLDGFTLEANGERGEKFTYKDTTSTSLVYTVLDSLKHNITNVTIDVKDNTAHILTLCEVEMYGECQSGTWDLGCTSCPASCSGTCHIDDGSCNMVCFGFKDPPDCIKACDKSYYGVNCTQKCPNNCDECHATYGQCYRCQPGFQGENCTDCTVGHWGVNCNMTCSKNCKDNNCDKVNGHCNNNNCLAGYQPPDCVKMCPTGQWGENCVSYCSNNCQNKSCDKVNGSCHGGCVAGFQLPNCIQDCPVGHWGVNCNMTCSKNCKDNNCDKVNGHCNNNNCLAGYQPPECDKMCPTGQWGENCVNSCSNNCQNKSCDKVNGSCHGGCVSGFKPPNCNQDCNSGIHGVNCSQNCSSRCDELKCNSSTGFCFACIPGYHGEMCNQVCIQTTYGQGCALHCNTSCSNQLCDPVNGTCNDCHSGRYGDQCDICPSGKYGKYCLETCSLYCHISRNCAPEDGTCFNGCQDGYNGSICNTPCVGNNYGPKCQKTCSDGCLSNVSTECHHISGSCLFGCKDGHSGELCVKDTESSVGAILGGILAAVAVIAVLAVGAILWKRKHRKSPKYVKEVDKDFIRLQRKNSFNEQEVNETDVDSAYSNLPLITENTKIAVDSLDDYLKSHNIKTLAEQYRKIPKPKNVSVDVGQGEDNKQKNRYKNICP